MRNYLLFLLLPFFTCCNPDDDSLCDSGTDIGFGSCVVFASDEGLESRRETIIDITRETVESVNQLMPTEGVRITLQSSPANAIPEIGIGGFNPGKDEVIISFNPNFADLDASIQTQLPAQIAHEMHHAKRRRAVGYGSTLLQAAVSEGLADCFAEELTDIDPSPWSLALTGDELDTWVEMAMDTWHDQGYNHSAWFLGSTQQIPRWAGYAIGYKLAKDYMQANPGSMASQLFDEPASSFEP